MTNIALYHGEAYQREKAVEKRITEWREELSNPELYRFEGSQLEPEKLEQLLGGSSLFSETKIIHVSQAEELTGEDAFPEIIDSHSLETEALLFESDLLKKSTALYKAIASKGETKKFSEPTGRNFPKYVSEIMAEHDVRLTSDAKRWIIQIMEQDLLRVEREAEKLSLYRKEGKVTLEEAKKVVWTKGKDKMFDFFDALFTKENREAIELLEDMLDEDVEARKIFFMLAGEVRKLIKVESLASEGLSNKKISDKTGIYNWLVKKKRGQLNNFEMEELEELLHQLHRQDFRFKQGKTDLEDALFRIIYQTYPAKN
ncbi:DNA polymerase III subunit delta [Candidatus Bipolaricaulota bacterium]|nr:DNA polymerase III subunit delta [Candidatus Bipolaricaulota bacterium]MBS3792793.1 DNA polymerase III subunit delta [Candidatus Bipolaricaulota bacterium]